MTDGDTQHGIAALFCNLDVASESATPLDLPTGLIEQQRLFRLFRPTFARSSNRSVQYATIRLLPPDLSKCVIGAILSLKHLSYV